MNAGPKITPENRKISHYLLFLAILVKFKSILAIFAVFLPTGIPELGSRYQDPGSRPGRPVPVATLV